MTDLEQLRAALADDRTPAGIDVAAIRTRSRRTRRRNLLASAAAMVAVVAAVAVPAALIDRRQDTVPAAAATNATLRCPLRAPDRRDDRPVVPFPARQLLVCEYGSPRSQVVSATLQQDGTVVAAAQRTLQDTARATRPCPAILGPPVVLEFVAADGRTATVSTQQIGCGLVGPEWLRQVRQQTTAAACPKELPAAGGGSAGAMLPASTEAVLVCRYSGRHQDRTPPLVAAAALTGRPAAALVEQADALPATQGEPSCPPPDPTSLAAIIGLGPEPRVRVIANLFCPVVTNGVRKAALSPGLQDTLTGLTG
jgi:hypothetical protein